MKKKYLILLSLLVAIVFIVSSCKEEEDLGTPRFFKPQGTVDNTIDNQLTVTWIPVEGVVQYLLDISRDSTFTQIDGTETVNGTTSSAVFKDLLAATKYFIRIQAVNTDAQYSSKYGIVSGITSSIFLDNPTYILDAAFIVKWQVKGNPVTKVVVRLNSGEFPVVKEVDVSAEEASQGLKTLEGFIGLTEYKVELFSGDILRGSGSLTTKESIEGGIDLRYLDPLTRDSIFNATLLDAPDGAIIVLARGVTYKRDGTFDMDKSIKFISGYSFNPQLATIAINKEFSFASDVTIGSIEFTDINFIGFESDSKYIFYGNSNAIVESVKFEGCTFNAFRAGFRIKGSNDIHHLSFNNCVLDSTQDYGWISCKDSYDAIIRDVLVTNCTFSNSRRFIINTKYLAGTPVTFKIENCTFYNSPWAGNKLIEFNSSDDYQASITISNCIFGAAGAVEDAPPAEFGEGFKQAPGMLFDAGSSNYVTSDFYFTGIESATPYSGSSSNLFKNPASQDFTIVDPSFSGASTAGDPRWRK